MYQFAVKRAIVYRRKYNKEIFIAVPICRPIFELIELGTPFLKRPVSRYNSI